MKITLSGATATYENQSAGSVSALARKIISLFQTDEPIECYRDGKLALTCPSLHKMATLQIMEEPRLCFRQYRPFRMEKANG